MVSKSKNPNKTVKKTKAKNAQDGRFSLVKYDMTKIEGSVSELADATGLPESSVMKLLDKSEVFINGWALNVTSIKASLSKNLAYRKVSLINYRGERLEGYGVDLLEKTGLSLEDMTNLINQTPEAISGWATSKRFIDEFKKNNPLYSDFSVFSIDTKEEFKYPVDILEKTDLTLDELNLLMDGSEIKVKNYTVDLESIIEYTIINLESGESLTENISSLVEKTGISKFTLLNLINGKSKIAKSYALSDFEMKVFDYKGNVYEGTISEVSEKIDFNYLSMARLVQNSDVVIKGYCISKETLDKEAETNIKYQEHTLYNVSGEEVTGYIDDLIDATNLNETNVRKIILDDSEVIKDWSSNKENLPESSTMYPGYTLYKMDTETGNMLVVTGTKLEVQEKTGLSAYLITRLEKQTDYSSYGWSFSEKTAQNPSEDKTFTLSKAFDRSRVITLISDDADKTIIKGKIDELIFKLGVTDPMIKRAILGSSKKIRSQKLGKRFLIKSIQKKPAKSVA